MKQLILYSCRSSTISLVLFAGSLFVFGVPNSNADELDPQAADHIEDHIELEQSVAKLLSVGNGQYLVASPNYRDDRGTGATGDWAPWQYKAEGGSRSSLAGIGAGAGFASTRYALFKTTFSVRDHFFSPTAAYPGSCYRRDWGQYDNRYLQNADDPVAYSDWDYGFYKAQCGKNEYVAGFSQKTNSLEITSLLCCFHDDLNRTRNSCNVSYVRGPSEISPAPNWVDAGRVTATCAEGRFVGGLSKRPGGAGGFNGDDTHAILCCN
jgi:hypothetical protein